MGCEEYVCVQGEICYSAHTVPRWFVVGMEVTQDFTKWERLTPGKGRRSYFMTGPKHP